MMVQARAVNSERFLDAFGAIERRLIGLTGLDRRTRFYRLVERAAEQNAAVRRYSDDLKEYADLRNAIVHERTDAHVIAEPNDRAVRQIEHIQQLLEHPPRVVPRFQKQVYTMTLADPVAVAAFLMRERDFSQLPILDAGRFVALLTTGDIAYWLGTCAPQEPIHLETTTVAEVLACHCKQDRAPEAHDHRFVARQTTIFDVLEAFQQCEVCGTRLEALLITEHGDPREDLLGIITIWDLPLIYDVLG
jgi:CBS domain-containing protein